MANATGRTAESGGRGATAGAERGEVAAEVVTGAATSSRGVKETSR